MPSRARRPRSETSGHKRRLDEARKEALALLAQHRPADDKEALDLVKIRSLIAGHPEIFSRSCEVGHITASAAIIEPKSRRTLLHYHRRLGRWLQVGGHLDGEFDIAQAALREAREETGLPDLRLLATAGAPTDIDIHTIPQSADEAEHLHLDFRYILITSQPEALAPAPGESTRFRWLPLDDAFAMGDEIDASLRRLLRKACDTIADSAL